jgi:hypothetical protein
MVQLQKRPGTMALGVVLAVIQLADHNWCFEIHHTFSVNVLTRAWWRLAERPATLARYDY